MRAGDLDLGEADRGAEGLGPRRSGLSLAVDDLVRGLASVPIWSMLAWQEVKQRYRRSLLGPFWLTISTGVMIGGMGPLFSKLFGQDMASYVPFLAVSFVVWQLILQVVTDGCVAFIASEGFIKQIRLPLSIYVLKAVWKNMLIFFHNLVIVVIVFLLLPPPLGLHTLLFPVGVLAIAVNGVWISAILGLICARFRDIPQIVTSLLQVAFFLTPVMWQPSMLGKYMWTVDFNPLYHFIEIIRGPLLGTPFRPLSWIAVGAMTLAGYGLMLALYSRYRARVAYWV